MNNEIKEFTSYMNSFYGPEGIYPSSRVLTELEVSNAVIVMLNKSNGVEFEGDSIDRERCRDILFSQVEQDLMYKR